MSFNKRFIDLKTSLYFLENGGLEKYYGKSDALIFEDELSSEIYNLYKKGYLQEEIISIINENME